jgi:repressor LexA
LYERFEALLKDRDITAYRVSKDTGIPASTFTDWKNGRSAPKIDKLLKLADYLGVPLAYLASGRTDAEEEKQED